jgi:hypothetical protein
MDKKLVVTVPIVLVGEAEGVKQQGGIMEQILREVEIECLPSDIPARIDADVSQLVFGAVLRVSDLPHSDKLKFITDADHPVAHVTTVKEEVVATRRRQRRRKRNRSLVVRRRSSAFRRPESGGVRKFAASCELRASSLGNSERLVVEG